MKPRNPVLLLLVVAAIAACAWGDFLGIAPNRLVSGTPMAVWEGGTLETPCLAAIAIVLLACSFARNTRAISAVVLALAVSALLFLIFDAGAMARHIMDAASPATRVSLGWAFWAVAFCLAMIVIDTLHHSERQRFATVIGIAVIFGAIIAMAFAGQFDALSLAREYAARHEEFARELARHCMLVLVAVGLALVIGAPLGLWAARRRRAGDAIFSTLNLLQTIPSVALFGLLIAPLSALGFGGIGIVPAIIALVLYSLLPIARNVTAGIAGIEPAVIDAAAGMGMTRQQILWRIEIPLGMPVFLAGLRIVTVQAIGLTVVAALIGAGGLGSFVFQGIGQYATDLVLLGALPTIAQNAPRGIVKVRSLTVSWLA